MMDLDPKTFLNFVVTWGWLFPTAVILTFLYLYNRAMKRRNKEIEENKKNLMNVTHRSNGVKHKAHE